MYGEYATMARVGGQPPSTRKCLLYQHDCQHLGCVDPTCPLCLLCQKRRCVRSFRKKYLSSTDVLEAACGAQLYVVVVDALTSAIVRHGLEETYLELSIVDGRGLKLDGQGEESLEACQILLNKEGRPLLAHGRSGAYTDDKKVIVFFPLQRWDRMATWIWLWSSLANPILNPSHGCMELEHIDDYMVNLALLRKLCGLHAQ
jgi:hypothetical protein